MSLFRSERDFKQFMTVAPELAQLSHPNLVKVLRSVVELLTYAQVIGIIREPGCCVAELVPGGENSSLRSAVATSTELHC
jgi:hypothetical protein